MNPLWSYLWPAFGLGVIIGIPAGVIGFRLPRRSPEDAGLSRELRRKRIIALVAGALLSIAATTLWHGPFGAADRFSTRIERALRSIMTYYEMPQVSAHLHHDPLTREVVFYGPADDFQRAELARLITQLPGVRSAGWSSEGGGVPLIVEGLAVSLLGFLLGLLLAYVIELRRRYNSQWNW
jgi:hypothetical protein